MESKSYVHKQRKTRISFTTSHGKAGIQKRFPCRILLKEKELWLLTLIVKALLFMETHHFGKRKQIT